MATVSAVAADKQCFVELLEQSREELSEISLATVTTDANPSIRAYMHKDKGSTKHCLDIWHISKNLGKNLGKKATRKVTYCTHILTTSNVSCIPAFSRLLVSY